MASPAIDAFITFRFLKLLVTPFNKTEAYRLGIIDERGKVLRKYKTLERIEERQAYTILHRLVFNIKKLIEKVPGGKSRLASYAAALFLIKEHVREYQDSDGQLLEKELYKYLKDNNLVEEDDGNIKEEITFADKLLKGTYILVQDVGVDEDDKVIGKKGDKVNVYSDQAPQDTIMGNDVFEVIHDKTKDVLLVTVEDIEEA
tara:strand:- start:138 stop:743 length:606 start_codon:yes stop_codon:yes gene_type:complete